VADIKDVLTGQLAISEQFPLEGEGGEDPFVIDLDDHHYHGTPAVSHRHYMRYPMVGNGGMPHMADVEKVARFASGVLVQGMRVVFVSLHPVPRAMCAARTMHLSVGGTIQGAIMAVNKVDGTAFEDDRVLDVMLALGGAAK
jgi:hypothetical protein